MPAATDDQQRSGDDAVAQRASPPTGPVRFAVVGCGGMGRWHARVLRDVPGARLVAAADPQEAARHAFASEGVPTYASLAELLAATPVDVVSVCTTPGAHAGVIAEAAAAGRHVVVEKPLAVSLADADSALAACVRAGVAIGVVHQQRARSASRAVHRLIQEGRLGTLELALAIHTWYRSPDQLRADPWRDDPARGGGVLYDQAVHTIDLLHWLLGPVRRVGGAVTARRAMPAADSGAEHTAAAWLAFDDGPIATMAASTVSNALRDDIAVELYGSRGSVRLEIRDYDHAEIAWLNLAASDGQRARRVSPAEVEECVVAEGGAWRAGPGRFPARLLRSLAGRDRGGLPFRHPRAFLRRRLDRMAQVETGEAQGHAAVFRQMVAAVRGEGPPLVSGAEARHALAVVDALRRSHAQGGVPVDIPAP